MVLSDGGNVVLSFRSADGGLSLGGGGLGLRWINGSGLLAEIMQKLDYVIAMMAAEPQDRNGRR